MSKKIMVLLAAGLLVTAVACESELDGRTAAEVSEPEPIAETEEVQQEAVGTRTLAFNQETSRIEWLGAKVTGDHDGGFHKWTGTGEVDENQNLTRVEFVVDTTSIWSDNERLTGHLKNEDFFEVDTYPEARFTSRSITEGVAEGAEGTHTVRGDMTIKETTKTIAFPVTVKTDDDKIAVSSEFTLMRFDFGIEFTGRADDLIRDEVLMKLHFELPLEPVVLAEEG